MSIEDAFAKEMKSLKAPPKEKRFWGVEVGLDCCVFIKVRYPGLQLTTANFEV